VKKTLYLIRHGESEHNKKNVFSGISDVPLSETGREQCKKLAKQLESLGVQSVYSSPLKRAMESAQLIFPGRRISTARGLTEINYGNYEGVSLDYKDEITKAWNLSPDDLTFPGGDNVNNHANNIYQTITRIINNDNSSSFAIISHRTSIRLFLAKILKLDIKFFRNVPCENCHVSILLFDGESYQIKTINASCVVEVGG